MGTQQEAISLINSGANVFLSGPAGSGKSWVIEQITDHKTVVCAPTGIAALNVGGQTCHSLFNLPLGMVTPEDIEKSAGSTFAEVFSGDYIRRIIIDEISMLRADYLDLIDKRLRRVKTLDVPFGGLQVIVVGDGWQLPPIVTSEEERHFKKKYDTPYWFGANVWEGGNFKSVVLEKIYRQDDKEQQDVLNKIRTKAEGWEDAVTKLNDWCRGREDSDETVLCNYRRDAAAINKFRYKRLKGEERKYTATLAGNFKASDCIAEEKLALKVGSKVIIIANNSEGGYVNGQSGRVLGFDEEGVVVDIDGRTVLVKEHKWEAQKYVKLGGSVTKIANGSMKQIPLLLGYASTVHKAQGLTLDACEVNLGTHSFAPHQTYVALSRCRNLRNILLTREIELSDIIVDESMREFYKSLEG